MKNKEKYKNELIKILSDHIAIDKDTGEPRDCHGFKCQKCIFELKDCDNKTYMVGKWLEDEHEIIDWSKVAVDTPILVRNKGDKENNWGKRYFSEYRNGIVYTFANGATSWSNENMACIGWDYAKLAESEGKHEVN